MWEKWHDTHTYENTIIKKNKKQKKVAKKRGEKSRWRKEEKERGGGKIQRKKKAKGEKEIRKRGKMGLGAWVLRRVGEQETTTPDRHECFQFFITCKRTNIANNATHYVKLGKKRRESSKCNYYIISSRLKIKVIIMIATRNH